VEQLQAKLVDQGGGLEIAAHALAPDEGRGDFAQMRVDQGYELLESARFTLLPPAQQHGDFARKGIQNNLPMTFSLGHSG
jgi:hypothetical protein